MPGGLARRARASRSIQVPTLAAAIAAARRRRLTGEPDPRQASYNPHHAGTQAERERRAARGPRHGGTGHAAARRHRPGRAGQGAAPCSCVNDGPDVLAICSGGFLVDAPYSPQRLSELAKMDGAIIISTDGGRIARANVHLVPDPTVPTSETGTRHRTAERVARSLKVPVVSASEEMGVINVYAGGSKHQLQDIGRLLDRANQALQTLERYKVRLDDAIANLTAVELEDVAIAARRRRRRAARRDGPPHRRRDRDDDHRARRRRPPAAPAARRALRRDRRRARPGGRRLPAARAARAADTLAEMSTPLRRRGARPAHRRRHAAPRRRPPTTSIRRWRPRACACSTACTGSADDTAAAHRRPLRRARPSCSGPRSTI